MAEDLLVCISVSRCALQAQLSGGEDMEAALMELVSAMVQVSSLNSGLHHARMHEVFMHVPAKDCTTWLLAR